ncbi:MAG: type 4a pilus biogenesis protein PilO [Clostridiales bacterium]|nr:type 4a pilus biogenesis protein PilO [Clostridiales bacterium]MCF8021158.1 type 4a pilus biogenesis protein PilO [Clostridiales bacterium]
MKINLAKREKYLIIAAALALILYIVSNIIFFPHCRAYSAMKSKLENARTKKELYTKVCLSVEEEKNRVRNASKKFNTIKTNYFPVIQKGSMLVDVALLADKKEVSITYLQPGELVKNKYCFELPVEIKVRGANEKVLGYINSLEELVPLSNLCEIDSLVIEPGQNKYENVTAQFIIIYYSLT